MSKRRKRRVQSMPLTVGQDPSLWRYKSLQDALEQNVDIIAQMILAGENAMRERLLDEESEASEDDSTELAS